jgi:protein ImuB
VATKWRVACVRIPRFPIGAVWHESRSGLDVANEPQSEPHWDGVPIGLAHGKRQLLRAVSSAAARRHVRIGMTVNEARARCADIEILPWDDAVIARELARASAAFLTASPQVSPVGDAPGTWWIGASGFDELGGERLLACTLQRIAAVWHPSSRVGVADTCVAARAATWAVVRSSALASGGNRETPLTKSSRSASQPCGRFSTEESRASLAGPRIVPAGGCAEYLRGAPLPLVPMELDLRETLTALGLRTIGAFAALAAGDVERRWGKDGLAAWRLANGDDLRRPVLARGDSTRFVSTELAMSAANMEPVLFIVRAALGQLVESLVRDSRAAAGIAITLTLDDGRGATVNAMPHTVTREVRPAKPLARVAPLFERCRALLDSWTLSAPVCAVTVTVSATAPMSAEQGDLLAAAWRDPAAADAAFERLRSTLGAHSVVRPIARDEHRPERAGAWTDLFDAEPPSKSGGPANTPLQQSGRRAAQRTESFAKEEYSPDRARLSIVREPTPNETSARLLETPEHVDVETAHGAPRTLWWRGRKVMITRVSGPERLSGDWWKDEYARDYWRCESDELARDFLLYRDAAGWRLQGWYD